jgi:predicted metal-dependent phosphoesterase TrpH
VIEKIKEGYRYIIEMEVYEEDGGKRIFIEAKGIGESVIKAKNEANQDLSQTIKFIRERMPDFLNNQKKGKKGKKGKKK